jgi:ABC-type bacteriocin/lantibiotic exporter with double-glycine peptidase domain
MPRLLPALALVAAAAACAAPDRGWYPLSDRAVLLAVPLVRQDRLFDCGMAAVAALCAYHGVTPDPRAAAELAALAEERQGLSGGEVRDFLAAQGLQATIFRGTPDRAETGALRHLDAGRPLLVMLSFDDGALFHYCLLVGYDPGFDAVHLLDPRRGLVLLPMPHFDRLWRLADRFSLLAQPAPQRAS